MAREIYLTMPITGCVLLTFEVPSDVELTDKYILDEFYKQLHDKEAGRHIDMDCAATMEWELTPYVSRGNVTYAHTSEFDWEVGSVWEDDDE